MDSQYIWRQCGEVFDLKCVLNALAGITTFLHPRRWMGELTVSQLYRDSCLYLAGDCIRAAACAGPSTTAARWSTATATSCRATASSSPRAGAGPRAAPAPGTCSPRSSASGSSDSWRCEYTLVVELQTKVREHFTITEKVLTRAFFWFKKATGGFKNLC